MFKSMRVVSRGAMIAYLGLALLAGVGRKPSGGISAHAISVAARALSISSLASCYWPS